MATLQELMAQKEALDKQIEQTKHQERGAAVEKVRSLMAQYGLTVADLGGKSSSAKSGKKAKTGGTKVAGEISQCLDRRILERPRPAAALAEGGARERQEAHRLRRLARARRWRPRGARRARFER